MAGSNAPQRFGRKRTLTQTEAGALGYQAQGSYPSGLKNVRSYALRSTLHFTDLQNETEALLFQASTGGSNKWDTNVLVGNSIPNGQALLVHEIRLNLSTPLPSAGAFSADQVNAFANFMRYSLWQFGRENAQWDAQFLGSEILPAVYGLVDATAPSGEAAPVRVGDFLKPDASFRLRVPVVIGQNVSFNFSVAIKTALLAGNPLVVANSDLIVQLKGVLTKVAAV